VGREYLYIGDHVHYMEPHVAKFCGLTPSTPKVLGTDRLNFKPIFHPFYNQLLGKPPSHWSMYVLASVGHSLVCELRDARKPIAVSVQ